MSSTTLKRAINLKVGDRIHYQHQEYEIIDIIKQPWSWISGERSVVNGMKITLRLAPTDFLPIAIKPTTSDLQAWDIYWQQSQTDNERVRSLSKKIALHSLEQVTVTLQ